MDRVPVGQGAHLARRLFEIDREGLAPDKADIFCWRLEDYEWEFVSDEARLYEWRRPESNRAEAFVLYRCPLETELWIMHWSVRPKGCGFGGTVMRDFLEHVKRNYASIATVDLEVRESNTAARRVYESAAFELVGRRPAYYMGGEAALLYRLRLL